MFRRMIALLLAFVMMATCFAMAEDEQSEVVTPEKAYEEWFLTVYPLLYSCYANSTWISNWYVNVQGGVTTHLQVTYLLKMDAFTFTEDELDAFVAVKEDYKDRLCRIHDFIHGLPVIMATVRELKEDMVTEVPSEYQYVDSLIEQLMTDMEQLRTELIEHIEANSTLQDFPTSTGSTKERVAQTWKRIEWISKFLN